jgi:hypothetical protein
MQGPKHQLSTAERRMLNAIASGEGEFTAPDFLAFHRLKIFGFITVSPSGRPTISDEGKQALLQN